MLGNLLRILTEAPEETLADSDARLALTALLVRLARSDHEYSQAEKRRIDNIVSIRFALSPFEAAALREEAETIEAEAPDTVRFTRAIKNAVPYEERRLVLKAAWAVVLADGIRTREEDALMRMIAAFLGISDVDSALARQSVAHE